MTIWSKEGESADELVHAFTVGDDLRYDLRLAPYDLIASIAHVRMLGATGLIPSDDAERIAEGLRVLHREFLVGTWTVDGNAEDVHSRIEELLTERLGEAAEHLHTGRSRNDQVLTAVRLWQKDRLAELTEETAACAGDLIARAREHEFVPLPGYTHLQRAMPASVGMFFAGHAQGLLEDLILLAAAWDLADRCPLGSGAGYGVSLPIDRRMTADLLGFARAGGVATADANGRGKVETAVLDAVGAVLVDLSRLSADVIFFTTAECGFFVLGEGIATGSSIMPQKRNPDVFELVRGRTARFLGLRTAAYATTAGLPSGYSRDLQETKGLLVEGLDIAAGALAVLRRCLPALEPQPERIAAAMTPEIYATDEAYRLVTEEGRTFRDAYRQVGRNLDRVSAPDDPEAVLRARTHAGATGKLGLPELADRAAATVRDWAGRRDELHARWDALLSAD